MKRIQITKLSVLSVTRLLLPKNHVMMQNIMLIYERPGAFFRKITFDEIGFWSTNTRPGAFFWKENRINAPRGRSFGGAFFRKTPVIRHFKLSTPWSGRILFIVFKMDPVRQEGPEGKYYSTYTFYIQSIIHVTTLVNVIVIAACMMY